MAEEDKTPEQEPAAQAAPAPAGQPAEPVAPKERRQRARAAKAAAKPARAATSPQERQAEREAERRRKAAARRARRLRERQRDAERRGSGGAPEPRPSLRASRPAQVKTRQGVVVSDRAAKTITVRIDVTRRHPYYEKVVRTSSTLHAHDEQGEAHVGDTVVVRETRPLSRTKRWRLVEVVERAR
jgi:small subunit ribosomal protein S17